MAMSAPTPIAQRGIRPAVVFWGVGIDCDAVPGSGAGPATSPGRAISSARDGEIAGILASETRLSRPAKPRLVVLSSAAIYGLEAR